MFFGNVYCPPENLAHHVITVTTVVRTTKPLPIISEPGDIILTLSTRPCSSKLKIGQFDGRWPHRSRLSKFSNKFLSAERTIAGQVQCSASATAICPVLCCWFCLVGASGLVRLVDPVTSAKSIGIISGQ